MGKVLDVAVNKLEEELYIVINIWITYEFELPQLQETIKRTFQINLRFEKTLLNVQKYMKVREYFPEQT